jgi:hypothetical protein
MLCNKFIIGPYAVRWFRDSLQDLFACLRFLSVEPILHVPTEVAENGLEAW